MRWLLKAAVQKAIGHLPQGDRLNYVFQRRVLRHLPESEQTFLGKLKFAFGHFDAFVEHGRVPVADAVFYEFGAGWDLSVPLAYYALGVERQILVDIRTNLRLELVNDSVRRFELHRETLEEEAGRRLREVKPLESQGDLHDRLGITYLTPCDARATGLPSGSADFASSTDTLEHIPEADLLPILVESRRLLKENGLLSCRIDLQDHYSYFDRAVSPFNFLKFSDSTWRLVNSPIHYQNRLRRPDYVRLLGAAGFEILVERVSRPTEAELDFLQEMKLAERFRSGYSFADLGAKSLGVVAVR